MQKTAECSAVLLFVFNDVADGTIEGIADAFQHITVVPLDAVFVVVVDDLVLNTGALCQFIAADTTLLQQRVQRDPYHTHPPLNIF